MVKILQAYNFAKQNTFALNGEILSATLINTNHIAISSAEQFIEIYDISNKQRPNQQLVMNDENAGGDDNNVIIDERLPPKYTLVTVGEVVHLIYCEAGKYLLTLEKENVASPVHSNSTSMSCTSSNNSNTVCSDEETKMFVRIYANYWKFPEAKLIDLPITIRIASMTTPKAPLVESIDVIELPLCTTPDLIQCCQMSGNIIVSSKDRIYLYEYTQCMHENTQPRFSFIDFLPFKFFVQLNFVPLKLKLAENVIACMNNRYCVVFKVIDILAPGTQNKTAAANVGLASLDNNYEADFAVDEPVSSSESSYVSHSSVGLSTYSHNSYETDSLETTSSARLLGVSCFPGRTPVDFNIARMLNTAIGREFEVDIRSQWEQNDPKKQSVGCDGLGDTHEIIIMPTRANDVKIKLINEVKTMNVRRIITNSGKVLCNCDDILVQYDIRKLLQICMKTSEANGRVVDILRCMDLKAIYQRKQANISDAIHDDADGDEYDTGNQQLPSLVTTFKHANRRSLKSRLHQTCVGYALLVASSVDGYLYQFCAQGKWYNENEKPIAVYSFTAPVLQVHINDYVIFAVTNESVETHTSRIGHKLFNNRFEYPSMGALFPEESSPDVSTAIAVVGLCSFMQVQYVCINREHLVLISNSNALVSKNQSQVDAAALAKKCSIGEVTKRNIAARFLAEAKAKHGLLRNGNAAQQNVVNEWTLYNLEMPRVEHIIDDIEAIAETYRVASSSNFYDLMEEAHVMLRLSLTLQSERMSVEREQKLRAKFIENCRRLADFSIRSDKKEVYLQATGFYKMCNLHLVEIYNNYIQNNIKCDNITQISAEQLVGLIYTVKVFLLSLGTNRHKSSYLNQMVPLFFTRNCAPEQDYNMHVPLSKEFLNMFIKYSPSDIPQIMLSSPVVADAITGELINYLKQGNNLTPDENLLLAVTACRMSNYLLAQEVISKTSRRDLAVALIKHKNVLFDDSTLLFQKQRQIVVKQSSMSTHSASIKRSQSRRQQKTKPLQLLQNSKTTNHSVSSPIVSFSDFCETILLAIEQPELIEAISDVFIHALCIEHSITLDIILQLFLNYIASHIGQKGYQTSQKVFVNILQVYYYDLYDVSTLHNLQDVRSQMPLQIDDDCDEEASSKAPSLNSERDNDSLANSIGAESNSCANCSLDERSVSVGSAQAYQLQEQQPPFKHNSNTSLNQNDGIESYQTDAVVNLKGLKILFRMYMGRLKELSDLITDLQSADLEQQAPKEDFLNLRMECIAYMSSTAPNFCPKPSVRAFAVDENKMMLFVPYIPDYKLSGEEYERHIKSYIRPIPCLLERPQYLNRLPPFERANFSYPNKDEGEFEVRFMAWHNELLTLILKIQSLLATSKIEHEIIAEFLAFIHKTPNLIGVDSFLVIILPKNLAINYMLNFWPQYLWHYGKSCGFTPKHWESLLRKILSKQEQLPNWKLYITEILNNLVAELTFEELLQCFPREVIQNRTSEYFAKEFTGDCFIYEQDRLIFGEHETTDQIGESKLYNSKIARDHFPMDNVDEDNVFELILRKAVAKQRSIALRSMIESTGTQLFDATNNPMYNL